MSNQLSEFYSNTQTLIAPKDRVILDGRTGTIQEVCLANTPMAEAYACEETGGLLILFDDGILILYPFGHHYEISRIEAIGDDEFSS